MLVCLLFFSFFSFSSFPLLYSSWLSLIPFPPPQFFTVYNCLTINPFCNSAIPTEVSAFIPWVNPSSPAPALSQGLLQPFPSAGDRHHLAEPLHLLRGGQFLLWLLLLSAQQVCFGAVQACSGSDCSILQGWRERGWRDASCTCIAVFHFFRCIFSCLLYGSSDCHYLYLFNPAPFARLYVFATVACCCIQPDQIPLPNCTNSKAAPQTTALVYF